MSRNIMKNKRIPLIWVLCPVFVIIMIGYLWIEQINSDISNLIITSKELDATKIVHERELKSMEIEIKQAETNEYIIAKARQEHGYMMPDELLFIIKNPEALQSNDDVPQMYIIEGDQF